MSLQSVTSLKPGYDLLKKPSVRPVTFACKRNQHLSWLRLSGSLLAARMVVHDATFKQKRRETYDVQHYYITFGPAETNNGAILARFCASWPP
jgi:hypothetical protein